MEFMKSALKDVTANNSGQNSHQQQCELFKAFCAAWKQGKPNSDPTFKMIPQFYRPLPDDAEDSLPNRLRITAQAQFLQKKNSRVMDPEEFKQMWLALEVHRCGPEEEYRISYDQLKSIVEKMKPEHRKYLTPSLFAQFKRADRVLVLDLFRYVLKKTCLIKSRIGLFFYDVVGKGYLRECDLVKYVSELVPSLPQIDGPDGSFQEFYVATIVRKFLFFLDHMRTGKVRIQDILVSGFVDELVEYIPSSDQEEVQDGSWFSVVYAQRLYAQYIRLDTDHNGTLSKSELTHFGTGTLTPAFIDRLFQECLTFEGEMDYKSYLDLILALENMRDPQALHYIFRVLDLKGQGYLDAFSLGYFFRAIQDQMSLCGQAPINFADVKDELFDMIKPKDPTKITLQDLINSGQGDKLVGMLIDVNGFWMHENQDYCPPEEDS